MRFLFVGEGLTDFTVIRNILIGFFNDKNLRINRLLPKDKEPVGWGNVLNYLPTSEFKDSFDFADYIVIQIDTDKCDDWNEGIKNIGNDRENVIDFVEAVKEILIKKIGIELYASKEANIIFAICVHEMECWLLPFITDLKAHQSKIVNCVKSVEQIANKKGVSINQKNYEDGKHYENFSIEMKKNRTLLKKSELNPSLNYFIETLKAIFDKADDKPSSEENIPPANSQEIIG